MAVCLALDPRLRGDTARNTLTPTLKAPTTAPSPGERFVTLERKAAAFDPLNLIRLTPA